MSFDRIAGPRKGKATANRAPAQTSGSVKGSNPGSAGSIITPIGKSSVKGSGQAKGGKGSKQGGKVIDNDNRGKKNFFNPKASN